MSEPKLISPLLDRFIMGQAISDHDGVRCYPALIKNTDNRYIVKIISIPASQVQLEALLLAGAYSSKISALPYYKELADDVAREADVLKKLSRFEGFVPYEDLQIVEMDDGRIGYEVYLLSPYKKSLERFMRKNPMTHLKAVNLGLDLCASMVMCRRAGYMYVDLKPENIFINEKNEFCVGDLGFVRLDSLKYASLPDKYRSPYTAPEMGDALSALNETLDTYAIGMVLYQVYNDGKLPGGDDTAAPVYADYEMAEIILKAIHKDPQARWKDPMEMGQALVAYMQRNRVNDVPIIPLDPPADEAAAPAEEIDPQPEAQDDPVPAQPETPVEDAAPAAEDSAADTMSAGDAPPVDEAAPAEPGAEPVPDESVPAEPIAEPVEEVPPCVEPATEQAPQEAAEASADIAAAVPAEPDSPAPAEPDAADLTFMDNMVQDDTAPAEDTAGSVAYEELSDETSDILAQADELLAMEVLEPVVAPEPIEVPMPAPIVLDSDPSPESGPEQEPAPVEPEEASQPEPAPEPPAQEPPVEAAHQPEEEAEQAPAAIPPAPKKRKGIGCAIALIVILALLLGAGAYAYHYYNTEYLQYVADLEITGQKDSMTVSLATDIDETLLTVVCSDSYGNSLSSPVENGKADFQGLNEDTIYKITVVIEGFHELRGDISGTYTTPAQTKIVRFEAAAGAEFGTAIITFTVEGKDTDNWTVTYSTEGEAEKSQTFSGHILTVTGLTPGKEYTFRLSSADDLYMVGTDTVRFAVSAPVYAENLEITGCDLNGITAVWTAPEGVEGTVWTVRCYSDSGFDQTIETTELSATFTGINPSDAFTIDVTTEGMSSGVQAHISARSSVITASYCDTSQPLRITVSWDYEGDTPNGGWLVTYTVEDTGVQNTVLVTQPELTIYPAMPNDDYSFVVTAADGTTVFDNTFTATAGSVQVFSGYGVTADDMSFQMCRTPDHSDWSWYDLTSSDYTSVFAPGEKASFVLQLTSSYNTSSDYIDILFVIHDSDQNLVCYSSSGSSWTYLWNGRYCELDIPLMPTDPGSYTVSIYFNGMAVGRDFFEIQ